MAGKSCGFFFTCTILTPCLPQLFQQQLKKSPSGKQYATSLTGLASSVSHTTGLWKVLYYRILKRGHNEKKIKANVGTLPYWYRHFKLHIWKTSLKWNLQMHAKLATFMKLKHKWEDLVYINTEHSICGSKCHDSFKYLSLDILNHTHTKSCALHLYYL